jgi:hypothetical protein
MAGVGHLLSPTMIHPGQDSGHAATLPIGSGDVGHEANRYVFFLAAQSFFTILCLYAYGFSPICEFFGRKTLDSPSQNEFSPR